MQAAVDLYRFTLLRALHLPLPQDARAERAANQELSPLLLQGMSSTGELSSCQYVHRSQESESRSLPNHASETAEPPYST
jgi:hypothetical protein